ncbi:hypothetical protein KAH37_00095 [bacterium]|nr:hypothetical protein [bacterium]
MIKISMSFKKKSLHLFLLLAVVLLYGMYVFFSDFLFYFHSAPPKDLGDAMSPNLSVLATVEDGDYIKMTGIRAVQGGTLTKGLLGEKYTLFYFTGSNRFLAIQKTPEDKPLGPAYVTVVGRAYSFKTNGYAQSMNTFFNKQLFIEMSPDGFLIHSGLKPGEDKTALVMFALMILLFLINVGLMVRQTWFPPAKQDEDDLYDD